MQFKKKALFVFGPLAFFNARPKVIIPAIATLFSIPFAVDLCRDLVPVVHPLFVERMVFNNLEKSGILLKKR